MQRNMIYVIRDEEGNFICAREIKKGYYYTTYTGITTGFTYYTGDVGKKTAEEKLKKLNEQFKCNFILDYIDLQDIPDGIRIENIITQKDFFKFLK